MILSDSASQCPWLPSQRISVRPPATAAKQLLPLPLLLLLRQRQTT